MRVGTLHLSLSLSSSLPSLISSTGMHALLTRLSFPSLFSYLDICYGLPQGGDYGELLAAFPALELDLGTPQGSFQTLTVPPDNYLNRASEVSAKNTRGVERE